MKFLNQVEIQKIIDESTTFEEQHRLTRIVELMWKEQQDNMNKIWILSAKLDKVLKKLEKE